MLAVVRGTGSGGRVLSSGWRDDENLPRSETAMPSPEEARALDSGSGADRQLDHLVVVVPDLGRAADYLQREGFVVTPESHHPFGTSNRLVMFPDCYLELVTVTRPDLVPETGFAAFVAGCLERDLPGVRMIVLKTDDAAAERERLLQAGIEAPEPIHFGREMSLPDGSTTRVEFDTLLPPAATPDFSVFYCRHLHPESVWHPGFLQHPNGAGALRTVRIDDPGAAGWRRLALLGGLATAPPARLGSVTIHPGKPALEAEIPDGRLHVDLAHPSVGRK